MSPISANITQTAIITAIVTISAVAATILYKKWREVKIPKAWKKVGIVKKVHIYPLKSGHRIELNAAEVTLFGLKQLKDDAKGVQLRDRVLIVYGDKDKEFRTARTFPKMMFIKVSSHNDQFAIDAPGMNTLYVKVPNRKESPVAQVKCWSNERIPAIDCGEEAASWLSRYITEKDSGLRLGYNDGSRRRDITKTHTKKLDYYKSLSNHSTGLFSDLTSVSLISEVSVGDLNGRLESGSVVAENFRHNIVVDGVDLQPYEENDWDWIKVGKDVVLRNVKECTRCIMTTINPETAIRDRNRQPLKTLEKYKVSAGPEKLPVIGANLEVRNTGLVNVGDPVYIAV